ncbi:golgin subfamily A member 4-like isoform X2 [Scyliorhinus canicula]|uniref:golgin subfamily A member 4-like isoform X2 n=1 Tax=Scyliorhinus canicula TaxID=7830 RepID=UPI0018F52E8C|nr:golgin subfamily A member 4-like isoform X2 [Scyliorhinus canicula]
MMGSKLIKVQSNQEKGQDAEDNCGAQLQEPHTSEEQHRELMAPTDPKGGERFESFPGESTDLTNQTLAEQLIKLKDENKRSGDRIAELEDYILKLQNFHKSSAEPEFKGNEAMDNQQIFKEKLRESEVKLEKRTEESATLRKKFNEMELSYHQLQFERDALKGKLASVRELDSLDSRSSDEEAEGKLGAKTELFQRIKNLEGLLKIKEMSEKELMEMVKELRGQLLQNQENQRMLSVRCAKLDQLTKQKEDIESKLEERYSQVEQLQKEKESAEEDYQEQIKMLLDEIKERDEAHSQLEALNKDLLQKIGQIGESRDCLESKIAKLKMDLEERVNCELKFKKQCADLEKTVRDWEHFEQQLNEQFKRVESKQNGKIKSLRKQLEEKDETLKETLQAMEELRKNIKEVESQLEERQHASPDILKEKKELEAELSRMAEAEVNKAGLMVKMRSRFEMELNEKGKELEALKDEVEGLNDEICLLREQQKEDVRKLQERNKMLEELMEDLQEGESKILQEKIARMEKLLNMKEETEEKLQARISKQETLLKEMEETQRRLAQRNEEIGVKQRGISEELHRWKTKCSHLEKFEREVKLETKCQRDRIKELEVAKTNLEAQLQRKIGELDELDFLRKEQANVTAELNKKIEELEFRESACQAAKHNLETQLRKRMKEFDISEASVRSLGRRLEEALEEKQCGIRKVETAMRQEKAALGTQLAKESQLVISLQATIKEECQLSHTLKGELHIKEATIKLLQAGHSTLLARIQALERDLEEAKKEGTKHNEWETNKREIEALDQRLEELAQSEKILKQTVDNSRKTEAASQKRIQELELSEQRLLDKINELTSKSQQPMTNDSELTGKLRNLHISERCLRITLTEKEKSEEVLKGKLWRLQNQLKMKEDEMKKQSEYFEHYKQKQQQQLVKLREREQSLHSQIFKLDRERIDLNTTSVVLRTELQEVTARFTKLEKAHAKRSKDHSEHETELAKMESSRSEREDQIKDNILVLQHDLKKLSEKDEATNQEKEQLRERLRQAEDNEDFLTHKLEDFRSRIHELKLSESSLQEQTEELEEENEKLRRELKEAQENESYLKEVLEEKEKLESLVEEKNRVHNMTLNNSESQLSSDEQETPLEVSSKYKHLSSLCSAMFHQMEEETSPNRYRDLKNSLTHLRSQLQNGDILFREELLQNKWTAVLDSARNKNTQTPSIGQCVQEAMIIAKLASESVCGCPKLSEAVKEGRIMPLLEANSCMLADLMQVLRTGDVEKVRATLQSPATQKELAILLDHEVGHVSSYDLSSSTVEKQAINETAQKTRKCGDYQTVVKGMLSEASVLVDTTNNESQSDQLQLVGQEVMKEKSRCLSVNKIGDCTDSDRDVCALLKTHFNMNADLTSADPKALSETIASLETEIQQLQTAKAEVGQQLQCRNNQLLKAAEEKCKLEDELSVANSEVSHLSRKLEEITKEKIQEKESMKNNLRKENEVLEKRNKELLNGMAKLEANQRDLEADFKAKSEECFERMSELKGEKSKLEDTISCMQKENAQRLVECDQTVETLSRQNEKLKKRATELESKDQTLAHMVTGMKDEIGKLMKENKRLLDKLENEETHVIHQTVHQLTREKEDLLAKVGKLEIEVEKHHDESGAAQDKLSRLENENTNLMNLNKYLVQELKAQGAGEITEQDELEETLLRQSDHLLPEGSSQKGGRMMMLKAERMCGVEQSSSLMEQKVGFNVLAEPSVANHTEGYNDFQSSGSERKVEDQRYLVEKTGNAVANDEASEVIDYSDKIKLLESIVKEKDESLKKLKLDYEIVHGKLIDAEEKSATRDLQLKHEKHDFPGKGRPDEEPVTEMTSTERNRSLEKLLERTEFELRSKQDELGKLKAEFEELRRKQTEAKVLLAPLKAKLSCLIQKCHGRNSLIVQLVRELYRKGLTNSGLIEEAEDMLNDTAILEYSRTFLSSHNQQGTMNINSILAGMSKQEQGLNHWFLSSLSHGSHPFVDSNTPLAYRPCVATADYCPNSKMPHTMLPVLPLSVGDVMHVSGEPDRHGMYVAEVNGELGLVPARFVEETDSIHYPHATQNKPTNSSSTSSPERIITLHQQLQQTQQKAHSNNYQVAPSVTNSDAGQSLLSTPCASHKVAPQFFLSRSHDELENPDSEACGHTAGEEQEDGLLSKCIQQSYCIPEGWCEIPYGQACNNRGDSKSFLSSGKSTSSRLLEMAARNNLSERLASNLKGHSIKHRAADEIHGERASKVAQGPPAPVPSARIIDSIGQGSLLIDWEEPVMDEKGCSNGTFVQGYRIFIDGEFYKSIMGSACTKILLEDLDMSVPFQVSIQTVGANGLVSEKVTVQFLNCQPHKKALSVQPHLPPASPTDMSSETLQYTAIYDYNPLRDSPNIHPSHELAFKEGDVIWLYGKQRRDGFCEAEVNGRRGLIPTSFLDASIGLPKTVRQKATRPASSPPGHHRVPKISSSTEHFHQQKLNNRRLLMRRV